MRNSFLVASIRDLAKAQEKLLRLFPANSIEPYFELEIDKSERPGSLLDGLAHSVYAPRLEAVTIIGPSSGVSSVGVAPVLYSGRISKFFNDSDFTRSETASSREIANELDPDAIANLKLLCSVVLDPAILELGDKVRITSGYRSKELNTAVGGSSNSLHMKGEAVDIQVDGDTDGTKLKKLYGILLKNGNFGQLILEEKNGKKWIHVSHSKNGNKGEAKKSKYTDSGMQYADLSEEEKELLLNS